MTTEVTPCGFRDDLEAYVDRALDEGRRLALDLHLVGCASCRSDLESLVSLDQVIRSHPPEIEPSRSFSAGFLAAFEAEVAADRVPSPVVDAAQPAGIWRWLAKPVLIPMSAAAVAAAVALISWPSGDRAVKVVDRTIEPKAVERAVAARPVPADAHPTTSLVATDKELSIEKAVQEVDGKTKPLEKKLAEAGPGDILEAEGVVPR